ncbi:uncharacterized protein LY89DRAFT_725657 [Mollisia scopiformis]|uniref:Uncharacterized protein n=1 Tax=Mollisia scopiformis TaxID=149040 RepID=A0A132B508_MOLSC|nr:uncharacterized protein LY89DRAFT_725657 [Mollisia scopiformis]KUJ07498.1 hypothetical protein LY89DRAFT_725657 [Mollisia scopiformis]
MAHPYRLGMHFIVSTDTQKADPETRKLIRSQVMRGKNRIKTPRAKRQSPTSWGFMVDPAHNPHVSSDRLIEACYSFVPRRVGSDHSCAQFSDEVDPAMFGDLIQFATITMRVMFPLAAYTAFEGRDKTWFDLLSLDAAYLHITAFAAENLIGQLTGRGNHEITPEATLHLIKGVQHLRERLLLGDEEAKISEGTVSVVLTLAIIAHSNGDYHGAKKHMEGLRKIVDLRGGLGSLRGRNFGKKLLMEMLRIDIGMAMHSGSSTVFFSDASSEPYVPYPDLKVWPTRKTIEVKHSSPDETSFLDILDKDLASAWTTMKQFCSLINLAAQSQRKLPPEVLLDTMASVMYRLLQMTFEIGSNDQAMRLGLLSLCHHIFLQWRDVKLPHPHFSLRFRSCLLDLKLVDSMPPHVMIWLFMIGAISTFPASENEWLKDCLRNSLAVCGIRSWDKTRVIMREFMWIDNVHDKPGKDIVDAIFVI